MFHLPLIFPSMNLVDQIVTLSERDIERKSMTKTTKLVPSGSSLINLMCSDKITGAFKVGTIVNIAGLSFTGKTMLALSTLAECSINKQFDDYKLVFDDVERANSYDIRYLFGKRAEERIQSPDYEEEEEIQSYCIEHCHVNIKKLFDAGDPFIYIIDSFDGLGSLEELEELENTEEAIDKGKATKGSYHTGKARYASRMFRDISSKIADSNSLLIILSQLRTDLDPRTRTKYFVAGGMALRYYSTHVLWLHNAGKETKTKGKNIIEIGNRVKAVTEKNKISGKKRDCQLKMYYDYGIDDLGSMVDFLVDAGELSQSGKSIVWEAIDFKGTRVRLLKHIEENNLERKLRKLTSKVWREREEILKLGRKRKYD